MNYTSCARFFLSLLLAVMLATIALSETTVLEDDWESVPPWRVHQKLADDKATVMAAKDVVRRITASGTEAMNQTDYNVGFYDIFIRVNDTTEIIYGEVTMTAQPEVDGVSSIEVDFQADMTLDSITSPEGVRLFSRAGDVVTVTLNTPHNIGQPFECTFHYHGHPTEGGFQGFSFDMRNGTDVVISSLSEPYFARSWWPCKDRMDDKADSFDIAIEVDTLFYVGSNGTLDSTISNRANTHTFYYTVRYPMVSYLFSLAISEYTVWYDEWVYNAGQDTMPIVNAVYPDMYAYSLPKLGITPYALDVLSSLYGMYPFINEKYGHSNFEWGGAMEHQTMTSTAGSSFGFSEVVIVHELGHQWWGDMITCESWGHIWLNEGWASYTEALYFEEKDGFQAYKDYMAGMSYTGGGTIYVYDTTYIWNIFHGGLSYDKGAWVCHMLRGVLGDQAFFDGIAAYYNSEYQWGAATTEEFRDVFEVSSGVELDWFFEDWIYGTYRPSYLSSYYQEASGSSGFDLYVRVWQTQTTYPEVFRIPVDFVFEFSTLPDTTIKLDCNERVKMFKLNFDEEINYLSCDPDNWVMKYHSSQNWRLYFITLPDELPAGAAYTYYEDSLRARGGSGANTFSLIGGALPAGVTLDAAGVLKGTPTEFGDFTFTALVDDDMSNYFDEVEFALHIDDMLLIPGDVDLSGEEVNVADLVYLVDYMFQSGPAPPVLNLADVDGSCRIDIADLVYLVTYMFQSGPAPVMGCVE